MPRRGPSRTRCSGSGRPPRESAISSGSSRSWAPRSSSVGNATRRWRSWIASSSMRWTRMGHRSGDRRRAELPEILASILEARGAVVSRNGMIWEAALTPDLEQSLGTDRVRLVAAPAGRAARGAEMDAAMTERILLLGRSHGGVTRLLARVPAPKGSPARERQWVRLHWRIRYGSDDLADELLVQRIPVGPAGGVRAPADRVFRAPTPEEVDALAAPDPELLAAAWIRGLRQLESRIRLKL